MPWRIHHEYAASPCRVGTGWTSRRRAGCPADLGTGVGGATSRAITALVDRLGLGYDPGQQAGSWLWCLGGPELLRDLRDLADADHLRCIDLQLDVCDRHQSISVRIDGHDLVDGEDSIELGIEPGAVPDLVVARVDGWLRATLTVPR